LTLPNRLTKISATHLGEAGLKGRTNDHLFGCASSIPGH
jgi:hypothetical protein